MPAQPVDDLFASVLDRLRCWNPPFCVWASRGFERPRSATACRARAVDVDLVCCNDCATGGLGAGVDEWQAGRAGALVEDFGVEAHCLMLEVGRMFQGLGRGRVWTIIS